MRYRRPILDYQHPLAGHRGGVIEADRRGRMHDRSPGVDGAQFRHRDLNIPRCSCIHFVYDEDIGHSGCGLPRMLGCHLERPQSIRNNDVQIRADKWKIATR
jgi:hypothetical protein